MATWWVEGRAPPDLPVVEAVARLNLAARRRGWSIRLVDPCDELYELLDLVGLADVVTASAAYRSRRDGSPKTGNSSG